MTAVQSDLRSQSDVLIDVKEITWIVSTISASLVVAAVCSKNSVFAFVFHRLCMPRRIRMNAAPPSSSLLRSLFAGSGSTPTITSLHGSSMAFHHFPACVRAPLIGTDGAVPSHA